jgi:UDP-N-acetylmuramoyl-L-alanyl-D-glutamate--2,6-diaminopimelate ligase
MSATNPMTLGALLPGLFTPLERERAISGLTQDSRKVAPGMVFIALPGAKADGRSFILDAATKGASAIIGIGPRPDELDASIAYAASADPRRDLALAAACLHPRQPETLVAVTGTSGKSSVADFTRQIFAELGRNAASIGTVGIVTSAGTAYGSLTTPDPITLHKTLDTLASDGITHAAMEASSHGLDQRRLDGVRLSAAAFLNLGHDHLDYHPTMDDYFNAKLRLFKLLPVENPAVINVDTQRGQAAASFAANIGHPIISTGNSGRTLRLVQMRREGFSQILTVEAGGRMHSVTLPLAGDFQAGNALVAAGLVIATGEPIPATLQALSRLRGVPGRLEQVGIYNGGLAIVDYAHKPDALEAVLATLRPYATNRLICVVGCGGDRDRTKRPMMGAIAAKNADIAIITDDNPRTESAAAIRAEVMAGTHQPGRPAATEIGDRAAAIHHAIGLMQPGDVVVIAGKGHETGQIIGDQTLPFSDHDEIRTSISARS